jgi:hypothetical protein
MKFILLVLLIFNLVYSAEDLILVEEFDRKLVYGENQIGSSFYGDISYYYSTRPSLLSKRCNAIQYVQQVYDLAFGMSLEEYLLGKVDLRSRILWGKNQNFTASSGFEFADVGVGSHGHEILDNNYFWLREGWVDLDLSRFMCVDKSINLLMGKIPYSVGRGISFGIVYAESPGYIGTDSSAVIDEFAPAFLLTMEIFSNKNHTMFGDIYCAILNNYAGSYEQNIDPIYSSRIWHCPDEAERGFGHISFALIGRLKYEATNKYGVLNVEPYALLSINPEASINVPAFSFDDFINSFFNNIDTSFDIPDFTLKDLNSSKLITIGCMTNWLSDRFSFNFEFAINKGGLKSYGKDNNSLFINNNFRFFSDGKLNSFGLLVCNSAVEEPIGGSVQEFIVNRVVADDSYQEIIDNSPKGAEYNGDYLDVPGPEALIRNSSLRFINPKKFDYQGAMGVCDCAFWLNDELVLALTAGFTTGGSFDIEQSGPRRKKFTNPGTKYIPDYDLTGSYGAFVSLQELYTGLWVKSAFGMGGPYPRPNKSIFWNFNSGNVNNLIFKELFNDLKFIGLSLNLYPLENVSFQANILNYWSFCTSETLDTEDYDKSIKKFKDNPFLEIPLSSLPRHLGIEIFLVANIDLSYLSAFISWAVFFPGERYYSSALSPLDYFDAYYILRCISLQSDCTDGFIFFTDTTKFNPSYLFNAGFSYTF